MVPKKDEKTKEYEKEKERSVIIINIKQIKQEILEEIGKKIVENLGEMR